MNAYTLNTVNNIERIASQQNCAALQTLNIAPNRD
jgi:hypothetical protein